MIKMKICVLIPSYNESDTIASVVGSLRESGLPVYVVDDGSEDRTGEAASAAGAVVIRNQANVGKGCSIRTGLKRAIADGYDAVILMDGDGQHAPADTQAFIEAYERTGAGVIIGSRMEDTATMPLLRLIVNKVMSAIVSAICGQEIPDSQCGFRMISREAAVRINLECERFDIDSEILIKASRANFKIVSVPIKTIYGQEKSWIDPAKDTVRFLKLIIKLCLARRRDG